MVYTRQYSELPTTFAKARNCGKGVLRRFDTLVKAREYAVRTIDEQGGVVIVYSKNPDNYLYAINNPMQASSIMGYVNYNKGMDWHYWNIKDGMDRNTGQVYFRSRPVYKNGKMAGRF